MSTINRSAIERPGPNDPPDRDPQPDRHPHVDPVPWHDPGPPVREVDLPPNSPSPGIPVEPTP